MKKLTVTWQKIVTIILGFLGIGTLTSCYGMPEPSSHFVYTTVNGEVWGDVDSNPETPDEPVKGISVCLNDKEKTTTDDNGYFEFSFEYETYGHVVQEVYELSLVDKDGTENGNFKKLVQNIDPSVESNLGVIKLENTSD